MSLKRYSIPDDIPVNFALQDVMERSLGEHWAFSVPGALPKVLGYLSLLGLAVFFIRLYQVRMMFRRVQKEYGIVGYLGLHVEFLDMTNYPVILANNGTFIPLWSPLDHRQSRDEDQIPTGWPCSLEYASLTTRVPRTRERWIALCRCLNRLSRI